VNVRGALERVVEAVVPARLGGGFRWLLASSWVSNLGDGLALAAGPLLVASRTHEPVLVALAALLQRLPWLVFGLYAGALADRLDRRVVVMVCDLLRSGVLVGLAVVIVTGRADITLVLVAMFVIGVAEVFADSATATLLPMLVPRADLGIANARLMAGTLTLNQLAGPPVGAFLFAAGAAVPFTVQASAVALSVALVARIGTPRGGVRGEGAYRTWGDVVEGFRWLLGHRAVRTLALVILAFNVTCGAAWSVLVLYATRRLGMGPVGFGLLTTVAAVGGLISTAATAGWNAGSGWPR
jgi:MFS family permease